MSGGSVHKYADEVRSLIEERLAVKGQTLEKALARAGRLLPKWAQREGTYIVHAQTYIDHPKLRLMIDDAKVEKAHRALVEHLRTIDPKERRTTRRLGTLGVVSFNMILVLAGLMALLMWRGFL